MPFYRIEEHNEPEISFIFTHQYIFSNIIHLSTFSSRKKVERTASFSRRKLKDLPDGSPFTHLLHALSGAVGRLRLEMRALASERAECSTRLHQVCNYEETSINRRNDDNDIVVARR